MNRSDFLRSLVLAPLAALAGCKSTGEAVPSVIGEDRTLVVPASWSCDTTFSTYTTNGATVWINCASPDSLKWVNMGTDSAGVTIYSLAGNYWP